MRQVFCAFLIDHLDADHITSAAFTDNLASRAVSRKTGYAENGPAPGTRHLVRFPHDLAVGGLPEFRRSIGLNV